MSGQVDLRLRIARRGIMVRAAMVSLLHEGVLELVRGRPEFAAELMQRLAAPIPAFAQARSVDPTMTQLVPVELHADAVVLLTSDKPELVIVIEAQLQRDEQKLYTWPAYALVARARHRCPCYLLVVTPNAQVARWARAPISFGCGTFRMLVCGPEQIPKITNAVDAARDPELAMLSAIAHGGGDVDTAVKIATAAIEAFELEAGEKTEQRALYWGLIERSLSAAAKEIIMKMSELKYPPSWYVAAITVGKARSLLQILGLRGIAIGDAQRERIEKCIDAAVVDGWLARSLAVSSVDELLG